jgi:plastocyanin
MNRLALGVLLVVGSLTAVRCGGSSPMSSAPTGVPTGGPAAVVVTIVGQNGSNSFSPNPVTLHVGAAIAWTNSDTTVHRIVQDSGGGSQGSGAGYGGGGSGGSGFTTDQVTPGAMTSSITFPKAGVVTYHCAIHPTMRGTITATN